ncbi:MAG: hypothetical protein HN737_06330 [Desulfobacterales bacterium]|nr:hypothetical protein [Desulfobacteraceae bacterium]MBT7085745.1 hypothetical protein [Desulfobacterales bacterium]MBT7697008.1 hypothetical protein [Desulfobacterales bacterium]
MRTRNDIIRKSDSGIITVIALLFVCFFIAGCSDNDDYSIRTFKLTILQTSDIHNRAGGLGPFLDYTPDTTGDDTVTGGYARLATMIKEIRNEQSGNGVSVLLFDSGDFFMGTVYDIANADPVTLQFFEMLDYDAVTLGNHEFDWGPEGLSGLLNAGITNGFDIPVVATNMITSDADAEDDGLETLVQNGTIVTKKVIEVAAGFKVGILGINGVDSDNKGPNAAPVTFNHQYDFIQGKVDDLRNNDGVQIVIVLSHSGIYSDGTGADDDLANNVSGIDIIASGHEHTATQAAYEAGDSDTIIFSPGWFGQWLSRLDLTYNATTGTIQGYTFSLVEIDDSISGDTDVTAMVESSHSEINTALSSIGMEVDTPVSRIDFNLNKGGASETGIGNLTADAIRYSAENLKTLNDGISYDVGVVASGVIRSNLVPGSTGVLPFADIYSVLSMSYEPPTSESLSGLPLISIYVTAPEIRNVCEIAQVAPGFLNSDYYINFSGIRYDFDSSAALLSGVTAVYLCPTNDIYSTVTGPLLDLSDNVTLYHAVVDIYALQMMGFATLLGLPVEPKDMFGNIIDSADFMNHRIDSSSEAGLQELLEWMGLLNFLDDNFPAVGSGISEVIYGESGTAMGRANIISP